MENPFKRGDAVVAVHSSRLITKGKTYTIQHVDRSFVIIDGYYDNGTLPQTGLEWQCFTTVAPPAQRHCQMILPTDPGERKGIPITTGVLDYFPLALAEVAKCSKVGNDQHNPGQPLRWDKTKSTDHVDCISRHLIDRHTYDTDGVRHAAKLAWRALALLETILEAERAAVADKA